MRVKAVDNDGLSSDIDSLQMDVFLKRPSVSFVNRDTVIFSHDPLLMKCTGSDSNGVVVGYLWKIDDKEIFTGADSLLFYWGAGAAGEHAVVVSAFDDDSLESEPDTFMVRVDAGFPVIVPVRDTVLSSTDSVKIVCDAFDPNGEVVSYLWDLDGSGWDDTTVIPEKTVYFTGKGRC